MAERKGNFMEHTKEMELTMDELVLLLNSVRDDTIINVVFEREGGDANGRGKEVYSESGERQA